MKMLWEQRHRRKEANRRPEMRVADGTEKSCQMMHHLCGRITGSVLCVTSISLAIPLTSSTLSPPLQIDDLRLPAIPHNTPNDILVTLIHFLMLRPRRYQRIIAWRELLLLLAAVADDGAVAAEGEDDGVFFCMMVDGGGGVGFGYHAGGADVWWTAREVHEGILSYHALALSS